MASTEDTRTTTHVVLDPDLMLPRAILALALLWTLIPTLTHLSPPLDVVEGYLWGREWPLVTYKHPALPAWLIKASRIATFDQIGWPVYLGSQLFVAATIVVVFLLGRDLMGPKRGAVAALSLVAFEHLSWRAPEFNHTVAQLPFWIGVIFLTWRATSNGGVLWWLALALVGALGLYTKLSHGLILITSAVWIFTDTEARKRLLTAAPWLALGLFTLLTLPLLQWLYLYGHQSVAYIQERSDAFTSPIAFLGKVALSALPIAVMLAVALFRGRSKTENQAHIMPRPKRFILTMVLTPILLVAISAIIARAGLRTTWAAPMLLMLPLLVLALIPRSLDSIALHRFAVATVIAILIPPGLYTANLLIPRNKDASPTRVNWPEREIGRAAAKVWQEATAKPLRIVAGDAWTAGLAALRQPDRPSILTSGNLALSPWIRPAKLERHGALVIWDARRPLSGTMRTLIGDRAPQRLVFTPQSRRSHGVQLDYVILPPK
jgi:4-amino-4-deoxy-L-arabinose transferase-like glycosyltransferase